MNTTEDLDVAGYTRDNQCGDCGNSIGMPHEVGASAGMNPLLSSVRRATVSYMTNEASIVDPLNLLTLERTMCVYCFNAGRRPTESPDAVLGGVRFGRTPTLRGAKLSAYRRKTRGRVLAHLVKQHPHIARVLFPAYTEAHIA